MPSIDAALTHAAAAASILAAGELPAEPARRLAVLTCMDARLDVPRMLGLSPGDAHILRNAGGIVTDDVLRSLVLSQWELGTREIMVIQHTRCGVLNLDEDRVKARVEAEMGTRPSFALGGFTDLEASVRASLRRLGESPLLAPGRSARGFVYDVATGRLSEVRDR